MKEFSWEKEERLERNKEKRNIQFLKSKGWKIVKFQSEIYVKHPDIGMTTVERALKEY